LELPGTGLELPGTGLELPGTGDGRRATGEPRKCTSLRSLRSHQGRLLPLGMTRSTAVVHSPVARRPSPV